MSAAVRGKYSFHHRSSTCCKLHLIDEWRRVLPSHGFKTNDPGELTGVIVSLSIITALSVAVLENPQIQVWLEEQRRKIQELLRSIGEELDPQSRRAAEAFAFEGQTAANDVGIRREAAASKHAAAIATGRSLEGGNTIYRIPVKGPQDPNDAEERRRKGREYLAKRNQEMEQRRSKVANKEKTEECPQSPTFDAMVDEEGKLKNDLPELPSPPTNEPISAEVAAEMREVERNLAQPVLATGEASTSGGWDVGSRFANPFGDEFALERSITPTQPPVPPKIALKATESYPDDPEISVPGNFTTTDQHSEQRQVGNEELSYEEQLAIAMSISEQEHASAAAPTAQHGRPSQEDAEMAAAIAASLRDMSVQEAQQPTIVDLTPSTSNATPRRSNVETLLRSQSPARGQQPQSPSVSGSDDLYGATPELTKARLANFNALQGSSGHLPFDPVRDAARTGNSQQASSTPRLDHETQEQARELRSGAQTPTTHTHSSFGFRSDDTDDFETVASQSTASRVQSQPRSEISGIEVVDLLDDSDVDMLSEEGDGIVTPDSWSEVGSREADSETEGDDAPRAAPIRL